jgi:hypothetical protein
MVNVSWRCVRRERLLTELDTKLALGIINTCVRVFFCCMRNSSSEWEVVMCRYLVQCNFLMNF